MPLHILIIPINILII